MKGTEEKDAIQFFRRMLENQFAQGDLEEAIRLSRKLDEMQAQALREECQPEKAAGRLCLQATQSFPLVWRA